MKTALLFVPLLLLAGCLSKSTEPEGLAIVGPRASLTEDALRITAVISPAKYGVDCVAQVMIDTDCDAATGYPNAAGGIEYVARLVELDSDDRFPVRHALPANSGNPGGWGAIAGWGTLKLPGIYVEAEIPRAVLDNTREAVLRVVVSSTKSDEFVYWDARVKLQDGPVAVR